MQYNILTASLGYYGSPYCKVESTVNTCVNLSDMTAVCVFSIQHVELRCRIIIKAHTATKQIVLLLTYTRK